MPGAYDMFALPSAPNSLNNKGNPHEIDAKATRGKCDLTRCGAWFGVPYFFAGWHTMYVAHACGGSDSATPPVAHTDTAEPTSSSAPSCSNVASFRCNQIGSGCFPGPVVRTSTRTAGRPIGADAGETRTFSMTPV